MLTVRQMLGNKVLKGIIWVPPETSVFDALAMMEKHKIKIVAVMQHGVLLGLFSVADNAMRVTLKRRDPDLTKVGDDNVMTPYSEVQAVNLDTELEDCMGLMDKHGVNHLPVLEGEGEYVRVSGLISNKDVGRELVRRRALRENEHRTAMEART